MCRFKESPGRRAGDAPRARRTGFHKRWCRMLQGEKLDRIRELAYRELEQVEDEEILSEAVESPGENGVDAAEVARPLEIARERRHGVPLRAITSEFEIPGDLRPATA